MLVQSMLQSAERGTFESASWLKLGSVRLVRLDKGMDERQCNIDVDLNSTPVYSENYVYVSAKDHSIRSLYIDSRGDPDEEWVHFSNRDDPVKYDPKYDPPC